MIKIPTFALLGLPNTGKTTLVSTLSFNPNPKISHISGNTESCEVIEVREEGRLLMQLIDTPGVQYAEDMYAWFKQQADHNKAKTGVLAKRFYEEHRNDEDMAHECELMKTLQEDVAIIYIADPTRPPSSDDECLIEVLRMCNNYRIAIINMPEGQAANYVKDWEQLFRRDFNASHRINGIAANFKQVLNFLNTLKNVKQEWHEQMEVSIALLTEKRQAKLEDQAGLFLDLVSAVIMTRVSSPDVSEANQRSEKAKLALALKNKIQAAEAKYQTKTLKLFNMKGFVALDKIKEIDIFNEKTQNIWGLSPWLWRGAAIGGLTVAGAGIDACVGGISFGAGALIGFGAGLVATIIQKTTSFAKTTEGLTARIPLNGNIHWAILNKALFFAQAVSNRAHGNRERAEISEESLHKIKPEESFCQINRALLKDYIQYLEKKDAHKAGELEKDLIAKIVQYLDA